MTYKLDDTIDNYFDKNFWLDLIEDTYNLDVEEYINSYCKNIKKALKLIPVGSKINSNDENFWKKVYQYKKIDYTKPITYKYFKEVMLSTHTLINLIHLQIDLHQNMRTIEESFEYPLSEFFTIDAKAIFKELIVTRIDLYLDQCTVEDTLIEINGLVGIKAPWANIKNLYREYWFWLWLLTSFANNCFDSLYKIKLESLNYRAKLIHNLMGDCCEVETIEIEDKKQQYNSKTDKEHAEWGKCRKMYNAVSDEYRVVKFITNSAYYKFSTEKIIRNMGNLNLDEKLYNLLSNAISCLFPIQENWFNIFKNYIFDNCPRMYQLLFCQHDFNSVDEIYTFLDNTTQRQAGLEIVRFSLEITQGKSDKTILNTLSDMEYWIKKNQSKCCPMQNALTITDKIVDKYTQVQNLIQQSSLAFTFYLNNPTQEGFEDINKNLKALKKLLKIIPN